MRTLIFIPIVLLYAACDITGAEENVAATYKGSFSGRLVETSSASGLPDPTPVVCVTTFSLSGTTTVEMYKQPKSDRVGHLSIEGDEAFMSQTGPAGKCATFTVRVIDWDEELSGTPSSLSANGSVVSTGTTNTMTFTGKLSGASIAATLTFSHSASGRTNGTNFTRSTASAPMNITLGKQ